MLFELVYIEHDIEKVNEVTLFYFNSLIHALNFSDQLVPSWFRTVFNGSPILREKLKNVYDVISPIDVQSKIRLYNHINDEIDIQLLCSDININPIYTLNDYAFAHDSIKKLFYHLYSDTLQSSSLLNTALNTSIEDHYIKWKNANKFIVCPFCGIENYTTATGTNRDPYDHWLCKSKYPLSAINFRNLIPIGDKCNQVAVKGEKDVLYNDNPRSRRLSFYPYRNHSGINISLVCLVPPTAGYNGEWDLQIASNVPSDQSKVETWINIFNVKIRYVSFVKHSLDLWKDEFTRYLFRNNISLTSNISFIKSILINWKNSLLSIKLFSGVILLEAYIDYLLRDASDSFILTFANINLSNLTL